MSAPSRAAAGARMPTFFIPHGAGPCFFMDWNPPDEFDAMAAFLRAIAATLPQPPRAILVVTAHWLAPQVTVGSAARPGMIFDYYGFPPHTYTLAYPAPGEPALAARVAGLLDAAGVAVATDAERGFDHGTFIPLMLMFPTADVPVVQLSLRQDLDAEAHLQVGAALAPLRDEGVLIIGSGMSWHNLRARGDARNGPVSEVFDAWLGAAVEADPDTRRAALADWENAPGARLCHPPGAEEHLLPLMVSAGAAGTDAGRRVYGERCMDVALSGYRFG